MQSNIGSPLVKILHRMAPEDQFRRTDVITKAQEVHTKELARARLAAKRSERAANQPKHVSHQSAFRDLMRDHILLTCLA